VVSQQRGVIFDLDDTLYLERDYVLSGYTAVAEAVAPNAAVGPETLVSTMWSWFESGVRTGTFDRLLEEYPSVRAAWSVPDLVSVYRSHSPSISLAPGVESLIAALAETGVFLGIVSDGHLHGQQEKAKALRLSEKFGAVVFTDQWGTSDWKPSRRGFHEIEAVSGLKGTALTYIGDNPTKDFTAPNRLGWNTVRLRCPGQVHASVDDGPPETAARLTVHSYRELRGTLLGWLGGNTR